MAKPAPYELLCLIALLCVQMVFCSPIANNDEPNHVKLDFVPDGEPMRDSITYVTQEAIDAYAKHGDCLPAFFDVTGENLRQANVSLWYNDFVVSKAMADTEAYQRFGEFAHFAREIMQTSDFECNLQSKGCNRIPSCKDVTNHLERRNSGLSTAELLDQARRIYLTFKQMDALAKYISNMHVSIA
tara:strand:- start:27 stop:584 length:558 start_codon:yes stop_codon:yes gene_type:complete